jgi:hypothetical protein
MAHEFVCEEELDACCDCSVDDEFGRLVLRCDASDAVHDGILALKCIFEGGGGGVVYGLVGDVRVSGWVVRRFLAGDGCKVDVGVFTKFVDDGAADVASSLLPVNIKPHRVVHKDDD